MKRIIGIVGLALLAGCGDVSTSDPVIARAPQTPDSATIQAQRAALTGGSSGGSVTYFSLLDTVGAFANGTTYNLLGPAASFGDSTVWVYGKGTGTGTRSGDYDWISFSVPIWGVNTNCVLPARAFTDVTPYLDTGALHLRGINGSTTYSGGYRPWGNNATGGQGAMYRDANGVNYVLVIKTDTVMGVGGNISLCPSGPGNIGDIGLLLNPSN